MGEETSVASPILLCLEGAPLNETAGPFRENSLGREVCTYTRRIMLCLAAAIISLLSCGGNLFQPLAVEALAPQTPAPDVLPWRQRLGSGTQIIPDPQIKLPISQTGSDYLAGVSAEGIYRWKREKFPVKVFMDGNPAVPGYRNSCPDVLASCFDEWVKASEQRLSWVRVFDKGEADIVCGWTDQRQASAEDAEAARTRTYAHLNTSTNQGSIYRATIFFQTRLPERDFTEDEVKKAYLHEVGHAFGLAGHSRTRTDIMYAAVNTSQMTCLSQRDKNTLNRLYGDYTPVADSHYSTPPSAHRDDAVRIPGSSSSGRAAYSSSPKPVIDVN